MAEEIAKAVTKITTAHDIIIIAGRGHYQAEHRNLNGFISNPNLWRFTWPLARQTVKEHYRIIEGDNDFVPPGTLQMATILRTHGYNVRVVTDMIDGFFDRAGFHGDFSRSGFAGDLINLCGSTEEMMKIAEGNSGLKDWYNFLNSGLKGERVEALRGMLSGIINNDNTTVVIAGIGENSNFDVVRSTLHGLKCKVVYIDRVWADFGDRAAVVVGDVEEITQKIAIQLYETYV